MGICQSQPIESSHRHGLPAAGVGQSISAPTRRTSQRPETSDPAAPAGLGKRPPPLPERGDSSSSVSSSSSSGSLTGSTRPELKNPQQVLIHQLEFLLTIGAAEDWDHSTIDTSELTTALSAGNVALLEKSAEGKAVLLKAQLTLNIRLSLLAGDWKQLAEQLATCSKLDISSPEISSAQDELAYHQEVEETCAALRQALDSKSVGDLESALITAERLKIQGREAIVEPARNTLAEWKLALQLVEEARGQKSYFLLVAALNSCQSASLTGAVVSAAALLLARIVRVREQALLGLHYVERTLLEQAVAQAQALGYAEEKLLGKAAELLALKTDQFVRAQYQTALSQKDQARADSLSLRMKEHFFLMHLDSFDWRHSPSLRPAAEFKSSSLFSRAAGKEQQRSMLRWTDTAIPTSLTRLEHRGQVKAATKIFQKLLAIVNDGGMKAPARQQLQQEILAFGFTEPRLRDEIFLQLLKMLTDTPGHDAYLRARELLAFCLQCFPPSREFDPYLESFLHRSDSAHSEGVTQKKQQEQQQHGKRAGGAVEPTDVLLSMLHDTQFGYNGSAQPKPPSVTSLASERNYRVKILPAAPFKLEPSFLSSLHEDRPDFDWLDDEQAQREIAEILAYPIPGEGGRSEQLHPRADIQSAPFVLPASAAAAPPSEAPTSASHSTEEAQPSATRIDVVDVEALLRQWDELAVEVAKRQEQEDSSDSSSDSDSGSDSGFETDEGFQKYRVKAVYEYLPDGPGKIALKPGQTYTVSGKQSGGWLLGKNERSGERGYFPEAYAEAI